MVTVNRGNGDRICIPNWVLHAAGATAALVATATLGVAGWIGSTASAEFSRQSQQLVNHEVRIGHQEELAKRVDEKLDRLLELQRQK